MILKSEAKEKKLSVFSSLPKTDKRPFETCSYRRVSWGKQPKTEILGS
jgi:hypothetical protein